MSCLKKSQTASGKWGETDHSRPAYRYSLKVFYSIPEIFTEQPRPGSGCTAELFSDQRKVSCSDKQGLPTLSCSPDKT